MKKLFLFVLLASMLTATMALNTPVEKPLYDIGIDIETKPGDKVYTKYFTALEWNKEAHQYDTLQHYRINQAFRFKGKRIYRGPEYMETVSIKDWGEYQEYFSYTNVVLKFPDKILYPMQMDTECSHSKNRRAGLLYVYHNGDLPNNLNEPNHKCKAFKDDLYSEAWYDVGWKECT